MGEGMSSKRGGLPWRQAVEAEVERACQALAEDRQMGASTLARAAASELVTCLEMIESEPWEEALGLLRGSAEQLRWARPSMAAPVNLLADAAQALEQAVDARAAIDHIKGLIAQSEAAETHVSQQAASRIRPGSAIMTISYSGTVLRTLLQAAPHVEHVYVCEGRPLMEGRQLAARLYAEGLAVTLLTDAQAYTMMPQVDTVLLGADAVLPDGSAVNKVGSALLALAAQQYQKPVWVVAERLKWLREETSMPVALESQAAAEVWAEAPDGLEVANIYFELVPAALIDVVISESES
jgi:translation initiation factor 2B subunit (eIF-2B alpha/beta/delta family)